MSADTRDRLDAAVREHLADLYPGDLAVDWVIVVGVVDDDGGNGVTIETSRESMPGYVGVGLLTEGLRLQQTDDED